MSEIKNSCLLLCQHMDKYTDALAIFVYNEEEIIQIKTIEEFFDYTIPILKKLNLKKSYTSNIDEEDLVYDLFRVWTWFFKEHHSNTDIAYTTDDGHADEFRTLFTDEYIDNRADLSTLNLEELKDTVKELSCDWDGGGTLIGYKTIDISIFNLGEK